MRSINKTFISLLICRYYSFGFNTMEDLWATTRVDDFLSLHLINLINSPYAIALHRMFFSNQDIKLYSVIVTQLYCVYFVSTL